MTIRRRVTHTRKDSEGDILSLANPGNWNEVMRADAIRHINHGIYQYYVQDYRGVATDVIVKSRGSKYYLTTNPDSSCLNNLDNLPSPRILRAGF